MLITVLIWQVLMTALALFAINVVLHADLLCFGSAYSCVCDSYRMLVRGDYRALRKSIARKARPARE